MKRKKERRPPLPPEERPPKLPKTAEDLAAIAVLDALRECKGEMIPTGLPLACVVKVLDYTDIRKANDAYAMVTVEGPDGKSWRMCVLRKSVKAGKLALYVAEDAALPPEERFRNLTVCKVKEKVYKFGFGFTDRRLLPRVKRHIFRLNPGVLYPVSAFPELKGKRKGFACPALLKIESQTELKLRQQAPRPKNTFVPPAGTARMMAALRLRRRLRNFPQEGGSVV